MPSTKEIKNRIDSIEETHKITNAMYLIASTKMRKAKREFDASRPYFDSVRKEIKTVFESMNSINSPYFETGGAVTEPVYALLVITADKGLAGAYNQNVLKLTHSLMEKHPNHRLFVVGEYGRQHFAAHNIPYEKDFLYTSQNPSFHRARKITARLLELFDKKEIDKIIIIYTDFVGTAEAQETFNYLLPLRKSDYSEKNGTYFEFYTDAEKVIESIVPSYVEGFVYSALVDSFCCEQSARMTAMDSANRNAEKLLYEIKIQYNHARQSSITQEITEISACAKYQKQKEA